MKTIVARFQEMKKAPEDIGEIDGEIVDANALETALRTVGIALRDETGNFRAFDNVIMDISERWGDMTQLQQRYIATTAAGSRQQSRFIALVQDHNRLLELTSGAANSAGASTEQFDKTMDSLQSKMNKMNNALHMFWTNLMDSEVIKLGITLFTELVEALNSLSEILNIIPGFAGGVSKSILGMIASFAAFKGIGKMVNSALDTIAITMTGSKRDKVAGKSKAKAYVDGIINGVESEGASLQKVLSSIFNKKRIIPKEDKLTANDLIDLTNLGAIQKEITDLQNTMGDLVGPYDLGLLDEYNGKLNELTLAREQAQATMKDMGGTLASLTSAQQLNLGVLLDEGKVTIAQAQLLGTLGAARYAEAIAAGKTTVATNLLNRAKTNEALLNKGGIPAMLVRLGLIVQQGAATKTSTAGIWANVTALWNQVAAQIAANATLLAGIGVVIAFAAAVWGISKAFQAIREEIRQNSLKGQMEDAKKTTEAAKKAAEDAKVAYDDLLSRTDKYSELQESLGELIKGTNEWKRALIEINSQVIELLGTYPELAKYISQGEFGQLQIDEAGIQEIIDKQLKAAQSMQATIATGQLRQEQINQAMIQKEYEKATGPAADNLYKAFQSGVDLFSITYDEFGQIQYTEALHEVADQSYLVAEQIYEMRDALFEYDKAMVESELATRGLASTLPVGLVGEDISLDKTFGQTVIDAFSDSLSGEQVQNEIKKRAQEMEKNTFWLGGGATEKLLEERGLETSNLAFGFGQEIANLRTLYADMAGIAVEDIDKDISKSRDLLRQAIAEIEVTEGFSELTNKFYGALKGATDKTAQKQVMALLSKDGKKLTKSMIDGLSKGLDLNDLTAAGKETIRTNLEELMQSFGFDSLSEAAMSLGYKNAQVFADAMIEQLTLAERTYQTATDIIDNLFEETKKQQFDRLTLNLTAGEQEAFAKQLSHVALRNGTKAAEDMLDIVQDTFKDLDTETFKKVIEQINITDLSSVESIRLLEQALKRMGLVAEGIDLSTFSQGLIEVAKASKEQLSSEDLSKAITDTAKIIKGLREGTQDAVFSAEQYQAIMKSNTELADDFAMDLEGNFVYVGTKLDDLKNELINNTQALLAQRMKIVESELGISDVASAQDIDIAMGRDDWGEKQARDLLFNIIKDAQAQDIDTLSTLGIGSAARVQSMSFDQINQILDEIAGIQTRTEQNMVESERLRIEDYSQTYQGLGAEAIGLKFETETDPEKIQGLSKAIRVLGNEAGVTGKEFDDLADAMESGDIEAQKTAGAVLATAVAIEEAGKRLDEYDDKVRDALEIFQHSIEGTADYAANLNTLTQELGNALGVDLPNDFLQSEERLKLLTEALDGNEESWGDLLDQVAEAQMAYHIMADGVITDSEDIATVMDMLDAIEFDIHGYADFTDIVNKLLELGYSVDEVQQLLNKIGGTSFSWEMEYEDVNLPATIVKGYDEITGEPILGQGKGISFRRPVGMKVKKVEGFSSNRPGATRGSDFGGGGGQRARDDAKAAEKGGSKKEEREEQPWKNTYDWLYNLVQLTNEEIRNRNKLEWKYNQLLKDRKMSATEVLQNMYAQEASLKRQQAYYDQQMEGRMSEQARIESQFGDVSGYAHYDEGAGVVQINWDAINAVTDQAVGDRISEYISKLEAISGQIDSIEDAQMQIIDQLQELENLGRNEYVDLERQVLNAIIEQRQGIIDKLSEVNDSVNDANAKLLAGLQQGINEIRDARQREEALSDIQEKERRLALMQSDTSGANALDILRLQKELEADRQSYTDSLIDLAIQNLQEGNDVAAEQRQIQIDLMQRQLDHEIEMGLLWSHVNDLLSASMRLDGKIEGTPLGELLHGTKDYLGKSVTERTIFGEELAARIQAGFAWYMKHNQTAPDGGSLPSGAKPPSGGGGGATTGGGGTSGGGGGGAAPTVEYLPATSAAAVRAKGGNPNSLIDALKVALGVWGQSNNAIWSTLGMDQAKLTANNGLSGTYSASTNTEMLNRLYSGRLRRYKKGGLADFTGPAWLDGTKSRPEMVLNQKDTQNFIQLKDILADLMKGATGNGDSANTGDITYNFDIKVEQMASDYDVTQMMDQMHREIEDSSRYRNVNALGFRK